MISKVFRREIFIIFSILIIISAWINVILVDGVIIHRDFCFPLFSENFLRYYYPTWNDFTSQNNIERFSRLFIMIPLLFMAYLGISPTILLKIFIIYTYLLMSISMYLFLKRSLNLFFKDTKMVRFIALIGSLIYTFNPVNLQFTGGISILFSVGVLPLMLYITMVYFDNKIYLLLMPLLLLLSLGHPFTFLANVIILFIFVLFLDKIIFKKYKIKLITKKIFLIFLIFLGFVAWFLFPYMAYPVNSAMLGRTSNLSYEVFNIVSNNSIVKILLLERDRFLYVDTEPNELSLKVFHYLSLSIIVILPFMILLLCKNYKLKLFNLFNIIGYGITTILALGAKGQLGDIYWYIISHAPFGWVIRSPLKFQLYQAFFISVAFTIAFKCIIYHTDANNYNGIKITKKLIYLIILLLIFIGIAVPGLISANTSTFKPINLPTQFYEINEILSNLDDDYKVMWYPQYNGMPTIWSDGHYIQPFDMKSSKKPTYITLWNYNYVNKLLYKIPYTRGFTKLNNFCEFLASLNIKYIVFHNDRNISIDSTRLNELKKLGCFKELYENKEWYLFEITTTPVDRIGTLSYLIFTDNINNIYIFAYPHVGVILSQNISKSELNIIKNISRIVITRDSIKVSLRNLISNPSFEEWTKDGPTSWKLSNKKYFKLFKSHNSISGEWSLGILSNTTMKRQWSWIYSDPIKVINNKKYLVVIHVKSSNTEGTHIKIQGYDIIRNKWHDIGFVARQVKESTNWNTFYKIIETDNFSAIRIVINAGWISDPSKGSGYTLIDEVGIYCLNCNLSSMSDVVNYSKISPTEWKAIVNAKSPFVLTFSETYDPMWRAQIYRNGKLLDTVKPIPLYGIINGFLINETGNLTIIIKYTIQDWYEFGLKISFVSFIVVLGYVIWDYRYYLNKVINILKQRLNSI